MYQQEYIRERMHFFDQKKKEQSFLPETRQFEIQNPNKKVTDCSRSTLGYTFLSNTNFSIDKTQEKHYFSNPNSQGPLPTSHPTLEQSSLAIGFSLVVDPQRDTFSRITKNLAIE